MRTFTTIALLVLVGGVGALFYIRAALRRLSEKETADRIASEVRRMEAELESCPAPGAGQPASRAS